MMTQAHVDYDVREYLVGHRHSRGLNVRYDRSTPEERLVEWGKAINKLTIKKSFHLQKKLELIEGETNQKIAQLEAHNAKLEDDVKCSLGTAERAE